MGEGPPLVAGDRSGEPRGKAAARGRRDRLLASPKHEVSSRSAQGPREECCRHEMVLANLRSGADSGRAPLLAETNRQLPRRTDRIASAPEHERLSRSQFRADTDPRRCSLSVRPVPRPCKRRGTCPQPLRECAGGSRMRRLCDRVEERASNPGLDDGLALLCTDRDWGVAGVQVVGAGWRSSRATPATSEVVACDPAAAGRLDHRRRRCALRHGTLVGPGVRRPPGP